jgi:hypothetical protein
MTLDHSLNIQLSVLVILFLSCSFADASSCPVSPDSYYSPPTPGGPRTSGMPPPTSQLTFVSLPTPTITCAQLEQLQGMCVQRINDYRSGLLTFSTGIPNPDITGLGMLSHTNGTDKCMSESALGDFAMMTSLCVQGVHQNWLSCTEYEGDRGQNACCPISFGDFSGLVTGLYTCLQSMWDEGLTPEFGDGHYMNMKSSLYSYASCGFAFAMYGDTPAAFMTQNFAEYYYLPPTTFPTFSPTTSPMPRPTLHPSLLTTHHPSTNAPSTLSPSSHIPSRSPTNSPTGAPSNLPTHSPTTNSPSAPPVTASGKAPPPTKRPKKEKKSKKDKKRIADSATSGPSTESEKEERKSHKHKRG